MKMRKQVLFLLFITVVSPIVLYTDRLGSFTSSINLPFSFDDFTARNEFIEDVSTLSLGGEVGKLNLLPQEPSNTLKEPIGIVYLENSTRSFPNSDVSTGENSKEINESEKELSLPETGELKTRVLSATEDENPIKQVTSEVHEENESDTLENPQSTEEEEHTEGLEDSEKEDELSLSEDATDNASEMENKKEQQSEQISDEDKSEGSLRTITPAREKDQIVMPDVRVQQLRDQLIRARVYLSLGTTRSNPHFVKELRQRVKEVRRALGIANKDSELPRNANDKLRAMEETLVKGKQIQNDCTAVIKKLRAIVHSTEEQLRVHKKQTTFLTQLAAKTIPKGLHCLPLRLSTEYFSLNTSEQQFPNHKKLEDPNLYHYAVFSDNILASAVVINSTISHAKDPKKHVFHIVTDRLNYAAMRMWFLVNPPGKATVQVQNIEEFTWLNSSYSPVLKQLGSPSMIDYYFRAHRASSDSNLKYRNPKYLSILNHLRFYLPEIFPKLGKVLFVDDDIVVQKDLTGLWSLNLNGKVNGAVETCGARFHRFDRYLNFSNPLISKNFDPHACGWAYGMNIFDLDEWKKQNITEIYHTWQKLNQDRQLWKLGTLPPGLITFWKRTFPLNPSWHVLGLGYNPSVNQKEIERASVIHYNGNMKPWLEIGIPKYKNYWAKFLNYDQEFLRDCNINP